MNHQVATITSAQSRSISPENPDGSRGGGARALTGTGAEAARDLGQGWKVSPSITIAPGARAQLCDIVGSGTITHLWLTTGETHWRGSVLRAFWDDSDDPAVETPLGDFFGQGWGTYALLSSSMITVAPRGGFNSYWPMPFRERARLTVENLTETEMLVYFQIDYELTDPVPGQGYLHAQWQRSNPVRDGLHPLLTGIEGRGHYVGTYLAWGSNSSDWWGEGEMKFYLDGDRVEGYPTVCGTGVEDYFGGAWGFEVPPDGYQTYSTPYLGFHQDLAPDALWRSQHRFGLYRWHVVDPIRFTENLSVEVQALGWRKQQRYLLLHDDVASTALFYLDRPSTSGLRTPVLAEMDPL